TPSTDFVTRVAEDFMSAESTKPLSCTSPRKVSTSILNALVVGSRASAVFTFAVTAESSICSPALLVVRVGLQAVTIEPIARTVAAIIRILFFTFTPPLSVELSRIRTSRRKVPRLRSASGLRSGATANEVQEDQHRNRHTEQPQQDPADFAGLHFESSHHVENLRLVSNGSKATDVPTRSAERAVGAELNFARAGNRTRRRSLRGARVLSVPDEQREDHRKQHHRAECQRIVNADERVGEPHDQSAERAHAEARHDEHADHAPAHVCRRVELH